MDENVALKIDKYKEAKANTYARLPRLENHLDQINFSKKVFCIPVADEYEICTGDDIVINGDGEAIPHYMMDYSDAYGLCAGCFAGRALAIMEDTENPGKKYVFVNDVVNYKAKITEDEAHKITEDDVFSPCFIDEDGFATTDENCLLFGQVTGVENGYVYVVLFLEYRTEDVEE